MEPKKAKFSGRPTRSAPLLDAISICSSATLRFASISEVLVSCKAAAKKSDTELKRENNLKVSLSEVRPFPFVVE